MDKNLLFSAKNIYKSFHDTKALDGVDLEVHEGEIVGLIGENGAGKSTLLKIIIGVQSQSSGEMMMHGKPYAPKNPREANAQGIGMVFQEQSLITNLTVGQNIFLGYEKNFKKFGIINWKKMYRMAQKVLDNVGVKDIPPGKKISDLNYDMRQLVEIAKVVNVASSSGSEHCLILLDEPTSVLNEAAVQRLFNEIRKLKKAGHSVIFVSHRLGEVLEISDRIYVYKDGTNGGNMPTKDANEAKLYEMMIGHTSTTEYYKLNQQEKPKEEVVLECVDLGLHGVFKHINFKLHKGEILGFCGVVGSGKGDVCSVLCGDDIPTSGEYFIKGKKVKLNSPSDALKKSILMIPKERLEEGTITSLSVGENIALSNYKKIKNGLFISNKKIRKQAEELIRTLRIKTHDDNELVIQLSGGNQQKVVFARALASGSDILILNHPTRGVDVGAKEEIYGLIREMIKQGKSIILLGDTLDECIGLSNRLLVMRDGLITGEFDASVELKPNQFDILAMMM